jgi:hypothetical protein
MDNINQRLEIRHGRKPAQPIALPMHEVPFEAVMAVSTLALGAALAAEWTAWMTAFFPVV